MKARSDLARRLGEKVARLRRKKKVGQKDLLRSTTRKQVSQLERGISVPRIETLDRIAMELGTTLSALFDFDSEEKGTDGHHRVMTQINDILRGRGAADLEAVLEILRRVFEIKRRERPKPSRR